MEAAGADRVLERFEEVAVLAAGAGGRSGQRLELLLEGGVRHAQRPVRGMPSPSVATSERCTSLTPPPNVSVVALR